MVFTHHCTFLINSGAHSWGRQPYNIKNSARDNALLAFFTYGEGYHNFHHKFESDYRNGFNWYEWDPTKWILSVMTKIGLAYDVIKTPKNVVQRIKNEASQNLAMMNSENKRTVNG